METAPKILQEYVSEATVDSGVNEARRVVVDDIARSEGEECSLRPPWDPASSIEEVQSYHQWFRKRVIEEPSAGNVSVLFAAAVVAVLGKRTELSQLETRAVRGLCEVIEDRPLPTILWADFVRSQLDRPQVITRIFSGCVGNARRLEERIARVFHESVLRSRIRETIVVFGYSATIVAALLGILRRRTSPLEIVTPELSLPNRDVSDGRRLADVLREHDPRIVCRVLDADAIIGRLKSGKADLTLMGCKVIGVRPTGELEVVNSATAERFVAAAEAGDVPVGIVAGSYKLWPMRTYERYRPEIVLHSETSPGQRANGIVRGTSIDWIATEDGIFPSARFRSAYRSWFTVENVPVASIRECLTHDARMASIDAVSIESSKVADAIDGPRRRPTDPPKHFRVAAVRFKELIAQPNWVREHRRQYVAIVGDEIVGTGRTFHDLADRIRPRYGYGPMFMAEVVADAPVPTILSPTAP